MTDRTTAASPAPRTQPGERLGPYRLVHRVGEGGMGVVHLAVDADGRAVAVKVLRPHIAADPHARARLRREVDTLQRVRSSRVAEVLDADPDGPVPYLVTEYVPGPSLEDVVEAEGPLGPAALARLGDGLGRALAAVHAAGVVHRDLKPGNVLVVDGDPVVIDFGIASVADDVRLTSTGLVMGTPGYLSPELVAGADVGASADWWGWAATMAFAATGRPPFGRGPTHVVLDRVRRGDADLDGVPAVLVPVLAAALSTDPSTRPSQGQLRRAVRELGAGSEGPSRVDAPHHAGEDLDGDRGDGDADATTVLAQQGDRQVDDLDDGHDDDGHDDLGHDDDDEDPDDDDLDDAGATVLVGSAEPWDAVAAGDPPARSPGDVAGPRTAPTTQVEKTAPTTQVEQTPRTSVLPQLPAADDRDDRRPHEEPLAAPAPALPGAWRDDLRARAPRDQPVEHQHGRPQTGYAPAGYGQGHPGPGYPHDPASGHAGARPEDAGARPARLRRPQRPALLLAWAAALAATAALAPVWATVLGVVGVLLARTVERGSRWLGRRRSVLGPRRGDVALVLARSPLQLLAAALTGLPTLLLPLAVGVAVVFLVGALLGQGSDVLPGQPVALAAGSAASLVTAWWGPGGRRLRAGAHTLARGLPGGPVGRVLVLVPLLVVAAGVGLAITGTSPDWRPLSGAPFGL